MRANSSRRSGDMRSRAVRWTNACTRMTSPERVCEAEPCECRQGSIVGESQVQQHAVRGDEVARDAVGVEQAK